MFLCYVIGWSLFGVHCILHASVTAQGLLDQNTAMSSIDFIINRYNNRDWVESVYSCLGWAAKISVFITEYSYLQNDREGSTHIDNIALGVGLSSLTVVFITFALKPTGDSLARPEIL